MVIAQGDAPYFSVAVFLSSVPSPIYVPDFLCLYTLPSLQHLTKEKFDSRMHVQGEGFEN